MKYIKFLLVIAITNQGLDELLIYNKRLDFFDHLTVKKLILINFLISFGTAAMRSMYEL